MKKYIVEVNDNEYEVTIREENEENSNQSTVESNKLNKEVVEQSEKQSVNTEKKQGKSASKVSKEINTGNAEVVAAPMSGKILSLRISEGDKVEEKQVLMTLEAMKMETEIVAPVSGKITKIITAEGSKCKQGDKLALIEVGGH